ncbi:phospholipase A2 inhibitor CNF-like [Astyanax mexicanus]|uniref:Phospholipase A2 inhibitor CNF-like n=1 Tax=Astyanax mexicanus TaxID=7994 RepID=A0A8T2L074_ASTMX|nr:phospholipase A2 inhibitor CNF-like [Astyanax mexicanus]
MSFIFQRSGQGRIPTRQTFTECFNCFIMSRPTAKNNTDPAAPLKATLRCNFCPSGTRYDSCVRQDFMCGRIENTCGTVLRDDRVITMGCMQMQTCENWKKIKDVGVICCYTNNCN